MRTIRTITAKLKINLIGAVRCFLNPDGEDAIGILPIL